MSRQENEKNPQPKAEKTDNAAPLESRIHLLTIIGEVEGHESLGDRTKSTKYEEILPRLALIEDDDQIEGILILLHTVGGDVEAGLAIAEMIASLSKPTVSLVLGGGHSIGVPLAVSADYSFIVPSATMVLHPVRTNGMFIGVMQTYRNMEKTQDRNHQFYRRSFRYQPGAPGGTDAGYFYVSQRCRNHAGRRRCRQRRTDQRDRRHPGCTEQIKRTDGSENILLAG